jgi:RNA polymerase sigma factor (sigma-70 family)
MTDEAKWLADRFEANRNHLRGVAYRMLGSLSEADDAVQEAWLRLSRAGTGDIENLGGWLTTVVARVCLDMLRSRKSRREDPMDTPEPMMSREAGIDPEQEVLLAESVGLALLVVLEALAPAERVAFVLHEMFDLPFEEIAPIVGRSPTAARQLASRARRRVHRATTVSDADLARQRKLVEAFLTAARGSDLDALLACSTLRSCSEPTARPGHRVRQGSSAVPRPWPRGRSPSRGAPGPRDRHSSTEPWESSGLRVGGSWWCSVSRSGAGRSSRSMWSPTPSDFASSNWRSSSTDEPNPRRGSDHSEFRHGSGTRPATAACRTSQFTRKLAQTQHPRRRNVATPAGLLSTACQDLT